MLEIASPIGQSVFGRPIQDVLSETGSGNGNSELQALRELYYGPNGREPLNPELAGYVVEGSFGEMFDHPLHREIFFDPNWGGAINHIIAEKERLAKEAWAEGDIGAYVLIHHRPYRIDALRRALWEHGVEKFWPLVGDVWIDTESANASFEDWFEIWSQAIGPRGIRRRSLKVMPANDRRVYRSLPETLTVYRGTSHENDSVAFSWTLDEKVAKWFAKRSSHGERTPLLLTAVVPKSSVLAYFGDRNEAEVVLYPFDVPDCLESVKALDPNECPTKRPDGKPVF